MKMQVRSREPRRWLFTSRVAAILAAVQLELAVAQAQTEPNDLGPNAVVAAKVQGEPIFFREVQREVAKVVKDRQTEPEALKILQAQSLEQLIKRRLILRYLDRQQQGASDQDVTLAIERAKDRLGQQQLTLEEYLRRSGLTEEEFKLTIEWQLGWQGYLDRYLSEKNLQSHFEKNRKEFDGSQVRAAHILLKVKPGDSQPAWDAALQTAKTIRAEITSGKIAFAEAAKKYSQAPSGSNGGDVGFISRQEPMSEPFSRAAFALEKGQVSEPVISPFGVHIIQCLEVKPGQNRWHDVRKDLEIAVTRYLFDWVADQERPQATVEYTGSSPHFKAGTNELAN